MTDLVKGPETVVVNPFGPQPSQTAPPATTVTTTGWEYVSLGTRCEWCGRHFESATWYWIGGIRMCCVCVRDVEGRAMPPIEHRPPAKEDT